MVLQKFPERITPDSGLRGIWSLKSPQDVESKIVEEGEGQDQTDKLQIGLCATDFLVSYHCNENISITQEKRIQ